MTLRTVLLYLDQASNADRLTRLATRLATRGEGEAPVRLIGAHVTPLLPPHGGIAGAFRGGPALRHAEAQKTLTERMRERFLELAREASVEAIWDSLIEDEHGETASLCERARAADLVMLPQPLGGDDGHFLELAVREVVTGSGRPVLVVPGAGHFRDVGTRLLIGWSPTREATRAVHDALMLVRPDCHATLMWVSHERGPLPALERSAHAMSAALARHGVASDVARWTRAEVRIGDALLNEAAERGTDLIVAGAYGHSRFYDAVIGATTSHLLEHMTVPVLFSH